MKLNKKVATGFVLAASGMLFFTACNDSFLDRYPETSITEKVFFTSVKDLETYTNNLYNLGSSYSDIVSDNIVYSDENGIYSLMRGELTPTKAGGWGWGSIRSINFMLARTRQVKGDPAEINHYIGLARLFRAIDYYGKVETYSDVPWYNRDLQTTDIEELYKTQDPRTLVVDSIMQDLDFAVKHIKTGSSKTRVHKYAALAVQARIALKEGTFRKYHPELNLNDGDKFLNIAITATNQIINDGRYSLVKTKQGTLDAYTSLFSSLDLTNCSEMIMIDDYDKQLGRKHGAGSLFNYTHTISRDLMEDYLAMKDGKAVPFHEISGYDKMTVLEVFDNRDPRMEQTLMKPGFTKPGDAKPSRQKLDLCGYPQIKFAPTTYDQWPWGEAYEDLPIIRYAEILLINAEAKAELGILTQEDVDKTINELRDRVHMPKANLQEWLTKIDPVQEKRYANVKSSQKGAVLEIRRERRIEMACEGVRYNDLMRWACGKLMEKAPEGIYIPRWGAYDLTGDGIADAVIAETEAQIKEIKAGLPEEVSKEVTSYQLDKANIHLTEGDHGYLRMNVQVGRWTFVEPKYYYRPIAQSDINVNGKLVQNKFWRD